jgi:hypothetical protein
VRLAWAVPNSLQTFQSAKIVLIPSSPGGAANLNVLVCTAQNGNLVAGTCAGPFAQPFTGVANQLVEVEIGALIASRIGTAGANYLAVLAYTTPTTTTDHIIGMRFAYAPKTPTGVATLGANTFTGTQTAPAFAGNGAALTNLPFPAGAATLGANRFEGMQSAPAFVGDGSGLTRLPFPSGAATLNANTFNGSQTIHGGGLDLEASTATSGNLTKNGVRFLHNFGNDNTFLGVNAGNLTMSGELNTVVGARALSSNTVGVNNTAIGPDALGNNKSGSDNVASGSIALGSNSGGSYNTATGSFSLESNTTGYGNVASGGLALVSNVSSDYNTGTGFEALYTNTSGSENTAVGAYAGSNATGSSNIYLGARVSGVAGESNTIYLGLQGLQNKTFIAGIRGITTGVNNAVPEVIDANGQLGTVSSSRRFKEDIRDMDSASTQLFKLRPVTFRYKQAYGAGSKPIQYGLIAEEVAEAFPELAVHGTDGTVETVHYETLNVLLLNEVQKQQRRIDALEERLNELLQQRRTDDSPH